MSPQDVQGWSGDFDAEVVTSQAASTQWRGGGLHVFDSAPQPDPVRSQVEVPVHMIVVSGDVNPSTQRIEGGPLLYDRTLQPGDTLIYTPDISSVPHLSTWERWGRAFVARLPPTLVAQAAESLGVYYDDAEFLSRFDEADGLLNAAIRSLADEMARDNPSGRVYADQVFQMMAAHLVLRHANLRAALPPTGGLSRQVCWQAEDLARARLSDPTLALADLAGAAGLSDYHFSRAYKRTTGEAPFAMVRRVRMEEAARLLRHTDLGALAVGVAVGYGSAAAFSTAFRRHHGLTPTAYRSHV